MLLIHTMQMRSCYFRTNSCPLMKSTCSASLSRSPCQVFLQSRRLLWVTILKSSSPHEHPTFAVTWSPTSCFFQESCFGIEAQSSTVFYFAGWRPAGGFGAWPWRRGQYAQQPSKGGDSSLFVVVVFFLLLLLLCSTSRQSGCVCWLCAITCFVSHLTW